MIEGLDRKQLLEDIAVAAREAGAAILEIVERGFEVEIKDDMSPVTVADRAAELIILAALARAAPGVPVIAEEEVAAGRIPAHGDTLFPRRPARRHQGIHPRRRRLHGQHRADRRRRAAARRGLRAGARQAPRRAGRARAPGSRTGTAAAPIPTRERGAAITAVASKSHFNQPTADYLEQAVGECDYVGIGSSLKFCIVAEGKADIYPRLSPTSEWDTAAGHAVLLAAGGRVDGPDGKPLAYGKRAFLNRGFVATAGWEAPPIEPFMEPFSGGGDLPQGV